MFGWGEEEENGGTATGPAGTKTTGTEKVPGVTETEIILGTHMPLSNTPAVVYAPTVDAIQVHRDYVNSQGGIHGRRITLLVADDHYSPPDAAEAVRRLVRQKDVFAIPGGLGDPTHYAVFRYLEEQSIRDLILGGDIPEFAGPGTKTRFAAIPDYLTETKASAV